MGGPGSGRRPKVVSNGHNSHAPTLPRVTFGDLLGKMQVAAPAAPTTILPQTAAPTAQNTPAPPAPPPERPLNRSFAKIAAGVTVNVGVSVIADQIRRGNHEPQEVSPEDFEGTTKATEDAIVRLIGDGEVPWWAGLVAAWGNLYLAMRVGAKPLEAKPDAAPEPATTTTTPPASPLGHGGPLRPPAPAGGRLAPIRVIE